MTTITREKLEKLGIVKVINNRYKHYTLDIINSAIEHAVNYINEHPEVAKASRAGTIEYYKWKDQQENRYKEFCLKKEEEYYVWKNTEEGSAKYKADYQKWLDNLDTDEKFVKLKNENIDEYNKAVEAIKAKHLDTIKKGDYSDWMQKLTEDPDFVNKTAFDYDKQLKLITQQLDEAKDVIINDIRIDDDKIDEEIARLEEMKMLAEKKDAYDMWLENLEFEELKLIPDYKQWEWDGNALDPVEKISLDVVINYLYKHGLKLY
jgi:hypothetical protein